MSDIVPSEHYFVGDGETTEFKLEHDILGIELITFSEPIRVGETMPLIYFEDRNINIQPPLKLGQKLTIRYLTTL